MNIAIINTLAKTKSTGKIAYGMYQWFGEKYNTTLYYGRPDDVEPDENIIRIESDFGIYMHVALSRVFGDQGSYSRRATSKLIKSMEQRNIDIVFLLNIHGYYLNYDMLFDYLSDKSIKVIYLMVDDSSFRGKCCAANDCEKFKTECKKCPMVRAYPKSLFLDRSNKMFHQKLRAYAKNDILFAGIRYTVEVAKQSALLTNAKFEYIDETVDVNNVYYPRSTEDIRKRLSIPENKTVIMGMGPFSNTPKGGRFLLQSAKKLEYRDDIVFVFPAFDVEQENIPSNFIPLGYVRSVEEMAEMYSMADLYVCTSYSETISNTCIEALACGTKLLVFNACGMPDCADDEHRTVVDIGDIDAMVDVISKIKKKSEQDILSCREYAVNRYDPEIFYNHLERFAEKMLK